MGISIDYYTNYEIQEMIEKYNKFIEGYKDTIDGLVAKAFIPNPNNLPFISHKDETKTNNCADNLEWVSAKENNNMPKHKQRISDGKKYVSTKGKAKTTALQCDNILYSTLTEFSISWELNPSTVWRWLNKKTQMPQEWKDRGLKYAE